MPARKAWRVFEESLKNRIGKTGLKEESFNPYDGKLVWGLEKEKLRIKADWGAAGG